MKTQTKLAKRILVLLFCGIFCLTGVVIPKAETNTTNTYGDFEYKILDDGTVEINKYTGTNGDVTVPSEIDGKKVTKIGYGAFDACSSLTNISIPD